MDIFFLIGRVFLGGFFLYSAYTHLVNTKDMTQYAVSKHVPFAKPAVLLSGLLLLLGGYTILTGVRVELGVSALVLFLLPTAFHMHAFWREVGYNRLTEKVQFTKDIALLGAVIMLLWIPTPWPLSFGF